jgi:inositol transport system ATP-binding protein
VKGLSREKPPLDPHGIALHDISFHVHAGEVWALPGWWAPGAPKWRAACLAQTPLPPGSFELDGVPYQPRDPLYALDQGVALVPEDRKKEGAVLGSIRDNLSLSCLSSLLQWRWFVNTRKEDDLIESTAGAADQNGQQRAGGAQALRREPAKSDPRALHGAQPAGADR